MTAQYAGCGSQKDGPGLVKSVLTRMVFQLRTLPKLEFPEERMSTPRIASLARFLIPAPVYNRQV